MKAEKDGRMVAVVRVEQHAGLRLCFEAAPAMTKGNFVKAVVGTWGCQAVDQEQSEGEEDDSGEFEDSGESRRQQASNTEFAGATLEFLEEHRYKFVGGEENNSSHGTWSMDSNNKLALCEGDDCVNGYEGIAWTSFGGRDELKTGWKLNNDSHDGLDILILEFRRAPS